MNHLSDMEALSDAVRLRAYGQHDPLVEYKKDGHAMFQALLANFGQWYGENKDKFAAHNMEHATHSMEHGTHNTQQKIPNTSPTGAFPKVGRNDPCPCGAKRPDGTPVKYKKCHGG